MPPEHREQLSAEPRGKTMTIGQLSKRAGVSVKQLRRYEDLGFIYTVGRSAGNYRLFDESALWCVDVIQTWRLLGLTITEISDLVDVYLGYPQVLTIPPWARRAGVAGGNDGGHFGRRPGGTGAVRAGTRAFTSARNAIAKAAKNAGVSAEIAAVKALQRPTPAAWPANLRVPHRLNRSRLSAQ